jgi:hypothetical protein
MGGERTVYTEARGERRLARNSARFYSAVE